MENATRCPVCDSSDLTVHIDAAEGVLTSAAIGSSRDDVSFGRVIRCQTCRFAFCQRRPSEDELASLYREMDVRVYEAETRGRKRTAEVEVAIVERHATVGRILDVGCASGAFLCAARDHGWETVGVEPSPILADRATAALGNRGRIMPCTLQEAGLPLASFDVVTLWDVLEHVPDPCGFLSACATLVREGGHVFANVPNLDSWPARLMGDRWPLLLPEHLNYFNPPSLRRCGDRAGLALVGIGRRWARFSASYVLYRLAQHRVPGVTTLRRVLDRSPLSTLVLPIPLGEVYAVWTRADSREPKP
jgi:2-polyprenyl-3-methyl-5-hydroxy-6-metoxy-1,4-benzoquinol methylase